MESVKLQVTVIRNQLDKLLADVNKLKASATAVTLTVNIDPKAANAAARLTNAQANLQKANDAYRISQEQTKQATENRLAAEARLAAQMERTAAAGKKAASANSTAATSNDTLRQKTDALNKSSESLLSNIGKFARWYAIGTVVSGVVRSFSNALDMLKAVDTELVTVRKVTGWTADEMERVEKQAYKTASAYGVAADSYLSGVAEFARAGYKELSEELGELSVKTQIVGDTDAQTATQFLLSMDAAYQYKGSVEKLTRVLDGANEIDNNYATSIQKIAEGLGKVAPIAAQVHTTEAELVAALGTITAVTQRSGTEAATALRALFLNIVGDTKTEIDEGVTWTTGEIAGLRDVIKQYAPAAYEAAEATGAVIDPMEAIGGLAQAMQEGLLTEQTLMEMVSDIGGKLRTSQLLALIQNWDMYQSMLVSYGDSIGSADKEVSNALDSWERKSETLKNTFTELVAETLSGDFAKGFLDAAIAVVQFINKLGGLKTVLIAIAGILLTIKADKIGAFIGSFVGKIAMLPTAFRSAAASGTGLQGVLKGIGITASSSQIAVGGLMAAITVLTMVYAASKQKAEEAAQQQAEMNQKLAEQGKTAVASSNEIMQLYKGYSDLRSIKDDTAGSTQKLTTAAKTLTTALGMEGTAVDELTGKYSELNLEVLKKNAADAEVAERAARDALWQKMSDEKFDMYGGLMTDSLWNNAPHTYRSIGKSKFSGDSSEDLAELYDWAYEQMRIADPTSKAYEQLAYFVAAMRESVEAFRASVNDTAAAQGAVLIAANDALEATVNSKESYETYLATVLGQTDDEATKAWLQSFVEKLFPKYSEIDAVSTQSGKVPGSGADYQNMDAVKEGKDAIAAVFKEIDELGGMGLYSQTIDWLLGLFPEVIGAMYDSEGALTEQGYAALSSKEAFAALLEELYGTSDATAILAADTAKLGNETDATARRQKALKDALSDVEDYGGLAADTIAELTSAYPFLIAGLYDANGELTAAGKAAMGSADAFKRFALAQAAAQVASARLDLSNAVEQFSKVAEAAADAGKYISTAMFMASGAGSAQGALTDAQQQYAEMLALFATDGSSGSGGGGGGGSGKDAELTRLEGIVALRESELAFMQERGDSEEQQVAKMREIQAAIAAQAAYLRAIGAEQTDINKLSTQWWQLQNDILDATNEAAEKRLELEEKILAVQEAQAALLNAQNERNVRIYNAATEQWEWVAKKSDVDSASDALTDAQKDLDGFTPEQLAAAILSAGVSGSAAGLLTPPSATYFAGIAGASTAPSTPGGSAISVGKQHNGNVYQFGSITLTEQQAHSMTVYDLAQLSGTLKISANAN